MKLKILFILSISTLLLSSSCTTLYQKSALAKSQEDKIITKERQLIKQNDQITTQENQIKELDQKNRNLEKELGGLQQQLAEAKAAKETIRIILPPAEVWKEDSTAIMTIDSTISAIAKDSTIIVVIDSTKTINKDSITLAQPATTPASFLDSLLRIEGHAAIRIGYKNATFDILILEDATDVQLFWKNGKNIIGSLDQLKKLAEKENKQLLFATNAGMYTPSRSPQGIYVENSEELVPLDTIEEAYGNFYMQPNGVFLIEKNGTSRVVTTEDYEKYKAQVLYATQSGPMAVINGQINAKFTEGSPNVHIRSGVGIDPQGRTIFLISNQRVNLHTFGSIFRDVFQCQNALYLDGAISQMYLPTLGRDELGGDFGPLIGVMKDQ